MKLQLAFLSLCVSVAACTKDAGSDASALMSFTVPSDSKAEYFVMEKGGQGNDRTIVTKRIGSSGTSYSKRLYNCGENTVKYLGTGDSLEAMAASKPDPAMARIQEFSIAHYVGLQACT
jgi:hypothetical protein